VNAYIASLAQLGYALIRDRAFPAWLPHRHPRNGTPARVVWLVVCFACAGVALTCCLGLHFTRLLFIPNALGMMVYVLSMAAAVKLFRRYSAPWLSGLISLVMMCAFLPFLGFRSMMPILVAILYTFYMKKRRTGRHSIRRNEAGNGDLHADAG